jgi:CTP synthase
MVPHVTDEIKQNWKRIAREEDADVAVVEIGGTVGDIENMLYLEAVRQMRGELDGEDSLLIHATLVPFLETTGEQKTKPTQHSVKQLRETGLEPDVIVARSRETLEESAEKKISLFCDVEQEAVISEPNLESVYQIPLVFDSQGVDRIIAEKLALPQGRTSLEDWRSRVGNLLDDPVARVGICGKYVEMDDSYVSVEEALKHAAAELGGSVEIEYIDAERIESSGRVELDRFDGVVVPGGFGERGVEGKLEAVREARTSGVPLLGLCYGMQLMVVEYARNVAGIPDASSGEWSEDGTDVVAEMPGQKDVDEMGGTMRLGSYTAEVEGRIAEIYGEQSVTERHRHRYEINPEYHERLESSGLKFSGMCGELAEYVELPDHRFFIGTQAHPEFSSSLEQPNPLYLAFMEECTG